MTDTVDTVPWFGEARPSTDGTSVSSTRANQNPSITAEMYNATEYKMDYRFIGKVVIIDNNRFMPNTGHQDRFGSEKDVQSIEEGFKSIGNFDIVKMENLCKDDFTKKLTQVASSDFSDCGCIVCVISSHGDEGRIWATDSEIDLEDILKIFHASEAKSLFAKPKIFIIQACRGTDIDQGATVEVIVDTMAPGTTLDCQDTTGSGHAGSRQGQNSNAAPQASAGQTVTLPNDADFLVMFASVEGKFAVRNTSAGSWYIQSLAEAFKTMEQGEDFLSVITRAHAAVAYDRTYDGQPYTMKGMKQMPCFRSMLTKTLIMKP